jgi:TonB family protein
MPVSGNLPRFRPPEHKGKGQLPVNKTRNYRKFIAAGLATLGIVLALAVGWFGRNKFRLYAGQMMGSVESLAASLMSSEDNPSPRQPIEPDARKQKPARWPQADPDEPENDTTFAAEDTTSQANGGQPAISEAPSIQLYPTPANFSVVPSPRSPMRVYIAPRISLAMLLAQVDPEYPLEARRQRIEGKVTLKAVIGKDGTVRSLEAVSGPALLVSAMMDAVRQWRYRPYLVDGQPQEVETIIYKDFCLADISSNSGTLANASW